MRYIDTNFSKGMLKLPRSLPGELIDLYIIKEMRNYGIAPEVVYTYESTLLWICEDNLKDQFGRSNFTTKELEKWASAQEKYGKTNR